MKRIWLGAFALATIVAAPALGADLRLPVKAPVAPLPVYNWTGWYIGVNAGAAIDDSHYNIDPSGCFLLGCGVGGFAGNPARTFSSSNLHSTGFTAGGQVGYNYQFSPVWVAGIEADFNYNGARESDAVVQPMPPPIFLAGSTFQHTVTTSLDWFGTLRGRVGFLAMPNLMLYGTAGLAFGQVKSSTNAIFPPPNASDTYIGSTSTTRLGWTAGVGAEWLMAGNWSVKAEYLYIDLGSTDYQAPCISAVCAVFPVDPAFKTTVTTREHVARVGLNYHFGGPIVARY